MSSNQFITPGQFAKEFHELLLQNCNGDLKMYRAIVYDWQTSMGFPANKKERTKFIAGMERE